MKKLMLTAAVVALAGATFARNVYDYKASVKYVDLKKTTLNFDGDKVKGYLKVIKSATLTGYLVTDPSCPCTATTDQGYQPPKTGFLVLQNKSAKQGPKLLPAGLYAKVWATKDAWKGTSNAEGYLFAGYGSIAAMAPGDEAAQAFGDDATSESEKLFGAYNSKSKAGTFVETWLDAAGFGKASKGDDDEEGCDFVPGSLCIENLAGSVIGGLWLCAENGYGEKFLCMDWTKTSDVISGSWSIKENKKLAKAELTDTEKQMAVNTKKDVGGEPNYDILAWVKAAGKAIKIKIVIALGGNALGNTPYEQLELVRETAKPIVDLIEQGNEVVIAHGNGPQVGMINLGMSTAAEAKAIKSDMPFPECGAMSQGYIGYHLQNAIGNELAKRGIKKEIATVITQVVVDENDKAFQNPTKPVGAFYDKETAEKLTAERGFTMVEDAGRGYRRVVPSPIPVDVVEKGAVEALIKDGYIVVTVGGGGIPVIRKEGLLYGTPAVIDKDFASEKLAELIDADLLFILTAVEKVAINYKTPDEKWLSEMTTEEALKYAKEGQFAPGSMLPKVQACVKFAQSKKGRRALITSLDKAPEAMQGKTGTAITL